MSITERELVQTHEDWFPTAHAEPLDMAQILLHAYDLGDSINQSVEVAEYLYWKQAVEKDEEAIAIRKKFLKAKDLFEECQRFGRFHPDYHAAKDAMRAIQKEMEAVESIRRFKEAENVLDMLLFDVASMLAGTVSDTIKVPANNPKFGGGGCSSGGSCSCGSGGCG